MAMVEAARVPAAATIMVGKSSSTTTSDGLVRRIMAVVSKSGFSLRAKVPRGSTNRLPWQPRCC
ncbi:unnamed protein product [Linum tenue]|uniref:Uncharacterized protein n=1 Tax=Linum tenue TaxID=586396 RepID=A0AAV0PSD2_9ROSI|nr:unnamed protein product [Linum tenue]